jgi:acyl-CoA reductase-like NAD-dependent aldehyde dehydrogenase
MYGSSVCSAFDNTLYRAIIVENPANGATLSTVVTSTSEDIKACVEGADQAFKSGIWSKTSVQHRYDVLSRLARSLASKVPEFAEIDTLQTGRPIREMRAQIGRVSEWL